eukprot:scaffold52743_cov41-Attheya_sp.AAC.2
MMGDGPSTTTSPSSNKNNPDTTEEEDDNICCCRRQCQGESVGIAFECGSGFGQGVLSRARGSGVRGEE